MMKTIGKAALADRLVEIRRDLYGEGPDWIPWPEHSEFRPKHGGITSRGHKRTRARSAAQIRGADWD